MSATTITLNTLEIVYFSPLDEEAFFEWLDKLPCISRVEGVGCSLYLTVNTDALDEDALRELLALFRRYGINMRVLLAFDRPEFADWFHDQEAYWYGQVFG